MNVRHMFKIMNKNSTTTSLNKITSMDMPAYKYLFKVNHRNIRKRCELCSELTIKTAGQRH